MKRAWAAMLLALSGCGQSGEIAVPAKATMWPASADVGGETVTGPELIDAMEAAIMRPGHDSTTMFKLHEQHAIYVQPGTVVRVISRLRTPGGLPCWRVAVVESPTIPAGTVGYMTPDELK
jgi:hypothetical protein